MCLLLGISASSPRPRLFCFLRRDPLRPSGSFDRRDSSPLLATFPSRRLLCFSRRDEFNGPIELVVLRDSSSLPANTLSRRRFSRRDPLRPSGSFGVEFLVRRRRGRRDSSSFDVEEIGFCFAIYEVLCALRFVNLTVARRDDNEAGSARSEKIRARCCVHVRCGSGVGPLSFSPVICRSAAFVFIFLVEGLVSSSHQHRHRTRTSPRLAASWESGESGRSGSRDAESIRKNITSRTNLSTLHHTFDILKL